MLPTEHAGKSVSEEDQYRPGVTEKSAHHHDEAVDTPDGSRNFLENRVKRLDG